VVTVAEEIAACTVFDKRESPRCGELWIGLPYWPTGYKKFISEMAYPFRRKLTENEKAIYRKFREWPGIKMDEIQYAGIYCKHQPVFGMRFHVPETSPLSDIGHIFSCTCACWPAENPFPTDWKIFIANRLNKIGLRLKAKTVCKMGEALIPLELESAWEFILKEKLQAMRLPQDYEKNFVDLEELGIICWEDMESYLRTFLHEIAADFGPINFPSSNREWMAIYNYPNSD